MNLAGHRDRRLSEIYFEPCEKDPHEKNAFKKAVQYVMYFSSILLRNTRLMAVLRNLFALLVSVDVVYCQQARKSYLTSTETRRQL